MSVGLLLGGGKRKEKKTWAGEVSDKREGEVKAAKPATRGGSYGVRASRRHQAVSDRSSANFASGMATPTDSRTP